MPPDLAPVGTGLLAGPATRQRHAVPGAATAAGFDDPERVEIATLLSVIDVSATKAVASLSERNAP